MNIFIDTNIYLSFYHFTSDDLEELKKLGVLLASGQVSLYLPEQVVLEFHRNRENKIADALNRLREQKLNLQFPQFCKDYNEYEQLRQLQRSYTKAHSDLVSRAIEDIKAERLKADEIIHELFGRSNHIQVSENILMRARHRMEIGNPPGKEGSLGDAINWEVLLESVPDGGGIYFITDDRDYTSALDSYSFNNFLLDEWHNSKKSDLVFFRSLSTFFRENFPEITLASELEKDLLIRDFANSSSFVETHTIIAKLRQYSDFSASQVNAIVQAAISNNQIYWIREDNDVHDFLISVTQGKEEQINPDNLALLHLFLKIGSKSSTNENKDLPF